jgi:PAS domain S-box-containing protein
MREIEELRARVEEAEETLRSIRNGEIDAVVVSGPGGDQIFTLQGVDHPYRRLIEEMNEGALTLSSEGVILYSNYCFANLVHTPLQDVIGSPILKYFAPADHQAMDVLLSNAREKDVKAEFKLQVPGGGMVPVYISASSLYVDDVQTLCVVVTDLTEQKRTEEIAAAERRKRDEEQLRANKLESLGILAGGLAHDLNNSLTTVLGNISLAKQTANPQGNLHRRLAEAEIACLQARDVTQQLLTFSKGGVPVKRPVYINRLLVDWVSFAISGANVDCVFEIEDDLWPVEIDEGQMSRVINNLVINAQQAMPEGGTIIVRATNIFIGRERQRGAPAPLPKGRYVRIDVVDHGMGIPENHLMKVFDPYFTTKQMGSGLGLSIAYSVTRSHNGHIRAESHLGKGTTFTIFLPATELEVVAPKARSVAASTGGLRVLVMDDQEAIRELISSVLTDIVGDEVTFATEGKEAIELYRRAMEEERAFDVVMMDLTVPGGMGGKDAVKKLRELDPTAKVIVFSGYSNDPIMAEYESYGFSGTLSKPFEVDELIETVHGLA